MVFIVNKQGDDSHVNGWSQSNLAVAMHPRDPLSAPSLSKKTVSSPAVKLIPLFFIPYAKPIQKTTKSRLFK